jgi:nitrate reductase gamma subunit
MTEMSYYKPWVLFWAAAVVAHGYMDYSIWRLVRSWNRGQQQPSRGGWTFNAVRIWLMEALLQRQLLALSFSRWVIHMLIFWGFACLGVLSLFLFLLSLAEISGIDGGLRAYFLYGSGHALSKVWGDGFGLCLLVGLLAASFRRAALRPRQLLNDQSDVVLLLYLIWLTLSGFFLEGLRLSHAPASISHYSFVGRFFVLPWAVNAPDIGLWLALLWSIHAFSGLGLLLYLPKSKLMHSLFGPVVIALNASEEKERKDIYWPRVKDHRPIK